MTAWSCTTSSASHDTTKLIKSENKMKIEIWSDIMCPFCYIGKRNLESALAQFSHKDNIIIEWKSFQLDPSIPEVVPKQIDIYQYLADRKGISYEQSKKMHEDVTHYAQSVGLEYNFDKIPVTNSLKAHRIIQYAKTINLGDQAEEVFFHAYFTDGKNLNEENTLIELGKEIGLSEADVKKALTDDTYLYSFEADIQEAKLIGVSGVPFFVFNRKYAVAGAQHPNVILQTIEKAYLEWQNESQKNTLEITNGQACSPDGECK